MPLTDRDYDLLSLYIDDALTPPERRAVESRLASDVEFRAEHAMLRQTVALVRSLPDLIAPRDLRLTPDMLAAAPAAAPRPSVAVRRTQTTPFRILTTLTSAAASLVLVLVGTLTLLRPGSTTELPRPAAVAMVSAEPETALPTEKTDDDSMAFGAAPPIGMLLTDESDTAGGEGAAELQEYDPALSSATLMLAATLPPSAAGNPVPVPQMSPEETANEEIAVERSAAYAAFETPAPEASFSADTADGTVLLESLPAQDMESLDMMTEAAETLPATEMLAMTAVAEHSSELAQDSLRGRSMDDNAVQDAMLADEFVQPSSTLPSPLLGFALVIVGLVLGCVTIIVWNRRV